MRDVHKLLKKPLMLAAMLLLGACFGGCATTHARQEGAVGEAGGLEQISEVRRSLRAACGKIKAVNAGAENRAALLAEAKDLTSTAVENWGCHLKSWGRRAPADYAGHPAWHAAARDLTIGMQQMLREIEADDAAGAFKACGAVCRKFVRLNEQAGVRRTSDVLFHFRKAAKPLAESLAKGDMDAVSAKVAQLHGIRDKALTDPVGGTGTAGQKTRALEAFSSAVDAFASAVKASDAQQIALTYRKMMSAMETAYDLFL